MMPGEPDLVLTDALRDYRRFVQLRRLLRFVALLLFCVFTVWTVWYLNIPVERLFGMFGRIGHMVGNRMLPPDFSVLPSAYRFSVQSWKRCCCR